MHIYIYVRTSSSYGITVASANASLVFQLFSFVVVCSGMISKGFGFMAFFTSSKASSVYYIKTNVLTCIYIYIYIYAFVGTSSK